MLTSVHFFITWSTDLGHTVVLQQSHWLTLNDFSEMAGSQTECFDFKILNIDLTRKKTMKVWKCTHL